MTNKKIEAIIKLLETNPEYRDSDKELLWRIWKDNGKIVNVMLGNREWEMLPKEQFMEFNVPESIRRARAQVQKDHPELASSKRMQELKDDKELEKGTFVYREELQ